MTPLLEREHQLLQRYLVLPDAQERLSVLVDEARKAPPFPTEWKTDSFRIRECQSNVWVVLESREDRFHIQCEAESQMVKGLVFLICRAYEGSSAIEITQHATQILQKMGVWAILSPTRQNGLMAVEKAIHSRIATAPPVERD